MNGHMLRVYKPPFDCKIHCVFHSIENTVDFHHTNVHMAIQMLQRTRYIGHRAHCRVWDKDDCNLDANEDMAWCRSLLNVMDHHYALAEDTDDHKRDDNHRAVLDHSKYIVV
jgi:hypothetical protein